jgi:hypothetical protein
MVRLPTDVLCRGSHCCISVWPLTTRELHPVAPSCQGELMLVRSALRNSQLLGLIPNSTGSRLRAADRRPCGFDVLMSHLAIAAEHGQCSVKNPRVPSCRNHTSPFLRLVRVRSVSVQNATVLVRPSEPRSVAASERQCPANPIAHLLSLQLCVETMSYHKSLNSFTGLLNMRA